MQLSEILDLHVHMFLCGIKLHFQCNYRFCIFCCNLCMSSNGKSVNSYALHQCLYNSSVAESKHCPTYFLGMHVVLEIVSFGTISFLFSPILSYHHFMIANNRS